MVEVYDGAPVNEVLWKPVQDIAIEHARSVENLCVQHGALISDAAIGWVRAEIFCAVDNERQARREDASFWQKECLEWAKMHGEAIDMNDWLLARSWWQRLLNVRRYREVDND